MYDLTLKRITVLTLCALAFCSCGRMTDIRLRDVETYVNDRPDSALVELEGIRPRLPWQKARHALLTCIALDKSYIDNADDSLARVALDWYDSYGPADKRMKSWYYLGLVQLNGKKYSEAIVSFERALKQVEPLANLRYKGLILRSIGDCYQYANSNMSTAAKYNQEAIQAFEENGDTLYADYARISLSSCYSFEDSFFQADSVLFCMLNSSRPINPILRSEVCLQYASSLMSRGYDSADVALRYYEYFRKVLRCDVPAQEYYRLAKAFKKTGQADSSRACLDRAARRMHSRADTLKWYDYHYYVAKEEKNDQDALYFLEQTVLVQNRLIIDQLTQSVETAKSEYFRAMSAESANKLLKRNAQILLLMGCFLLVVFFLYLHYRQKKQELELAIVSHHELTQQLKERGGAVVSLISGRVATLSRLLDQYEQLQKPDPKDASRFDRDESAREKIRQFQQAIDALRKDTSFIMGLEDGLDASKDRIMSRLRKTFESRLTEEDYRILTLLFAGIDGPGISYVTGVKIATVRVKKYRYRERFEKLPDGPDKALFLREID